VIFWCHVGSPRQFIGLVCVARSIHQLNVVVGQISKVPIDLRSDLLRFAVVLEIGVVGDNQDGVRGVPQEVSPVPKSSNNGKQLPVVYRVVLLSLIKRLRVET